MCSFPHPKVQSRHVPPPLVLIFQEMASRGISLVYSRGDESTRKTLVEALVGVLQVSGGYRYGFVCWS